MNNAQLKPPLLQQYHFGQCGCQHGGGQVHGTIGSLHSLRRCGWSSTHCIRNCLLRRTIRIRNWQCDTRIQLQVRAVVMFYVIM